MKKVIFTTAVLFILTFTFALHPLWANKGIHKGQWDNITDNVTLGVIVTGGGVLENGATFGMGVVAKRKVNGHFTYMSDNLDIHCKASEVFDVMCNGFDDRTSFVCEDKKSDSYVVVEVFSGEPGTDKRGFLSVFDSLESYDNIDPVEEGFVEHGISKVHC